MDRLGVRYIDRITGKEVDDISKLVRPEVCGITGTKVASHALHTLSENMFELDGARVMARWGGLPPGSTIDPAAIEPVTEKSWILDLDMFSSSPAPFAVDRVVEDATRYAERVYTFFRWAVPDAFLRPDLATHMITMAGLVPNVDIPVVFTGLRPGEKIAEELLTEEEEQSHEVRQKILVARSPPPPADLAEQLAELREAAELGDRQTVLAALARAVPTYRSVVTVAPVQAPPPTPEVFAPVVELRAASGGRRAE